MRERLPKILDQARFAVLAFSSLGIIFHLDSSAADPLAPKTFWFATGAGLFGGLSLVRLWWGSRIWLPWGREGLALLALPLASLFSFLAAPSRPRSEATLNAWLLLFALALSAYDFLAEEKNRRRLLYLLSLCLSLAALRGLLQLLRLDLGPSDLIAREAFHWRLSASFGNPNFFAGFLVLLLPLALWLAMEIHLGFLALAFLAGLMALGTGSKAGLLALCVTYLAFGHLGWRSDLNLEARRRFLRIWGLAGIVCAMAGAFVMWKVFVARYVDPTSYKQSAAFRLVTWQGSLDMWKAAPLLGHGPGSFSAAYPAFRIPEAMREQGQHSYEVTHPENWMLQMMAEEGLLGFLAFCAFLGVLLWGLWKKAHSWSGAGRLASCLLLCFLACLSCNLASLDLFLPSTSWFFALLAALALRQMGSARAFGIHAVPFMASMVSALILLLSLAPAAQAQVRWRSSRLLFQAKALSQASQWEKAAEFYEKALEADPLNLEALYFKGANQLDWGRPSQALAAWENLAPLAPDYVLIHDKKARAFKALGKMGEAAGEWERQLKLDPWYLPAAQELSGLYAALGNLQAAERVLSEAAVRFPERQDLKDNLAKVRKAVKRDR